jgi:cleavage and polyadenylation specificity factor subunit 3
MTHPTKAIYFNLLTDFAKLADKGDEQPLFTKADVEATMDRIEVVDFDQTIDVNGIKVCCGVWV